MKRERLSEDNIEKICVILNERRKETDLMNKKFTFYPQGTCSQIIEIELDGDTIKNVTFIGGCEGNLSGISRLIAGMKAEEVIEKLEGTTCGFKGTSCPDQLSKALKAAIAGD